MTDVPPPREEQTPGQAQPQRPREPSQKRLFYLLGAVLALLVTASLFSSWFFQTQVSPDQLEDSWSSLATEISNDEDQWPLCLFEEDQSWSLGPPLSDLIGESALPSGLREIRARLKFEFVLGEAQLQDSLLRLQPGAKAQLFISKPELKKLEVAESSFAFEPSGVVSEDQRLVLIGLLKEKLPFLLRESSSLAFARHSESCRTQFTKSLEENLRSRNLLPSGGLDLLNAEDDLEVEGAR